jgi:hypothetical protein
MGSYSHGGSRRNPPQRHFGGQQSGNLGPDYVMIVVYQPQVYATGLCFIADRQALGSRAVKHGLRLNSTLSHHLINRIAYLDRQISDFVGFRANIGIDHEAASFQFIERLG